MSYICLYCTARFDHHCGVVATCIAQLNHRCFAFMLVSGGAACAIYAAAAIVRVWLRVQGLGFRV